MGTMTRKEALKRAQKRADLALPIASDLSPAARRARRKIAKAGQTTAKKKAAAAKKAKRKTVRTIGGVAKALKGRGRLPK